MTSVLQRGHSCHPFWSWKTFLKNTQANRASQSLQCISSSQEAEEEMFDSVSGPTSPPPTTLKCTASLQHFLSWWKTSPKNTLALGDLGQPRSRWPHSVHCSQISPFPSCLPTWLYQAHKRTAVDLDCPLPPSPPSCSFSHLPPRCRAPSPLSPQQSECYQHTPGVHCSHFWWHPASEEWTSRHPKHTPH